MNHFYISRVFFIVIFLGFFIPAFSQNNLVLKGDTLILNKQAKFWINEEVFFGDGSLPDKTYSYIYEAPNSLVKLIKYHHKKKLLSPGYNGYKARIIKFEQKISHEKNNYDYDIIVLEMPNGKRYWCDVVKAFDNHEILLASEEEQYAKKKKAGPQKKTTNKKKDSKSITVF